MHTAYNGPPWVSRGHIAARVDRQTDYSREALPPGFKSSIWTNGPSPCEL